MQVAHIGTYAPSVGVRS